MKYTLDKLKFLLVSLAIIFVGFIFAWLKFFNVVQTEPQSTSEVSKSLTPAQKSYVDLSIEFEEGSVRTYEDIEIKADDTPYSVLASKMAETGSEVKTKKYDFGLMVEEIDGTASSDTYFWSYLVNGQMGNVASDKYILKDKDVVEWKYTKIQ